MILTLQRSYVCENIGTMVLAEKKLKKGPVAAAFTANPVLISAHPMKEVVGEAARESSVCARPSMVRLILTFCAPLSASITKVN